jgi:5-hydroxyisourate hydrolase
MAGITTHVLDTALGKPAAGLHITLRRGDEVLFDGTTDQDGRARLRAQSEPGTYALTFETGGYNPDGFFPSVTIDFTIVNPEQHYHVPLLLSPFGYSTYRGS